MKKIFYHLGFAFVVALAFVVPMLLCNTDEEKQFEKYMTRNDY